MQRYERQGFTRTFTNDIYHVEEQLQAYDPHLFVMWNPSTGEHLIVDGLIELSVMKIPQIGFPELSSRLVDHMKKIHTANGFSASKQVMESDEKRERENERKVNELAENFAKDTLKSAKKIAYTQ